MNNISRGRDFSLYYHTQTGQLWGQASLLSNGYCRFSGWNVKPITYLHLLLRLRMHGTLPLISLYTFMTWFLGPRATLPIFTL
jgi:hypothetical protein